MEWNIYNGMNGMMNIELNEWIEWNRMNGMMNE